MTRRYEDEVERARRHQGPLDERLAILRDASRELSPHYALAVDRFVERLEAVHAGRTAPKPGTTMPDFLLPDHRGKLVRLATLRAHGPVVVVLFRGVWCSFCRVTLTALAEAEARVRAAGGQLVAISPQRAPAAARHLDFAGARFPLLSDYGGGYTAALGLTVVLGPELEAHLRGTGIDFEEIYGASGAMIPIPATFVIRRDGVVAARHLDADPRRRMEIDALVAAVAQAQAAS